VYHKFFDWQGSVREFSRMIARPENCSSQMKRSRMFTAPRWVGWWSRMGRWSGWSCGCEGAWRCCRVNKLREEQAGWVRKINQIRTQVN